MNIPLPPSNPTPQLLKEILAEIKKINQTLERIATMLLSK